jgi:tetratricopeptide (TPR) repeat protein
MSVRSAMVCPDSGAADFVQAATNLMARGQLQAAQQLLETALVSSPTNAQLHWQLGVCHAQAERLNLAFDSFTEAARLDPNLAPVHACLANWYLVQNMVSEALKASEIAFSLAPSQPRIALLHARILESAGQQDAAWNLACQLVTRKGINVGAIRLFGRMARYRDAAPAALKLALNALNSPEISTSERAGMHFTAADLLDGLNRFDEAFAHAAAGNAIDRPPYDPAAHARAFDEFVSYFTAEKMRSIGRSTETSSVPVFILGMPRSGTSLVEQILASHSQIHGAGELDFMQHVYQGAVDMLGAELNDYPRCLDRLTADQATGIGQVYLQPLVAMNPAAAAITDKLPLNFLHLGLMNLILPGARVIHVRRNPLDTCLSCHMNSFRSGHEFKFDLNHLGQFHRLYQRLMAHWRTTLDLQVLEVDYEQIVMAPEQSTRQMLAFLNLPFEESCLRFHQSGRPVTTSSLQQVRQPMYHRSIGRWRAYEKHLEPLKQGLGL